MFDSSNKQVIAKFKGTPSLGYMTGKSYELSLIMSNSKVWISREDGSGECPYDTLTGFLKNWEILRV